MLSKFKNVYVLAPHTDDGELGAGGMISKLIENGANVYYFAFSTAEQSVPEGFKSNVLKTEVINATAKLGIKKDNVIIYNYEVRKLNYARQEILEDLIERRKILKPDLVLMPSLNDIHQDHSTIAHEGLRAFKNTTILGYELIWNNLTFATTSFVKLDEKYIQAKCDALKEYKSQAGRDYMSEEFIFSLARTRGVQIGCKYAESFEVIRWVMLVGIHQPNFMPWLGYFSKIAKSNVFIFLDDVQIQKTGASYTNRVSININSNSSFLTLPIKRISGVSKINEVKFINEKFKKKIISSLQSAYGKAIFYKENKNFIFELINFETNSLSNYNINFIEKISSRLDLNTTFIKSSSFNIKSTSTQRLIDLVKYLDGDIYLSGSGGDNYQEKDLFTNENIELMYNKFPNFEYKQCKTDEFINGLSIIDAIFNIGFAELSKILQHKEK